MREIKFRAWDIDHDYMNENIGIDKIYLYDFKGDNITEQEGLVIMQYTGSKDKNGIEIYDGDILHVIEQGQYGGEYNVDVKWIDYSDKYSADSKGTEWSFWGIQCMSAKEIAHHEKVTTLFTRGFLTRRFGACIQLCELTNKSTFDIEVIGNIYSNPDLLEVAP